MIDPLFNEQMSFPYNLPQESQQFIETTVNDKDYIKYNLISMEDIMKEFFEEHPELNNNTLDTFDPNMPWIQTFTGQRFTPLDPRPESIMIKDIAHALSMQCRFTGHISHFYSVAQHSVLVSYLCDIKDQLHGLLHDGSEAYICDFSSPLKKSGKFNFYIEIEHKIQTAIYKRFGLDTVEPESVKVADKLMLVTEARDLLPSKRSDWVMEVNPIPLVIQPLLPHEAEKLFLDRFIELTKAI